MSIIPKKDIVYLSVESSWAFMHMRFNFSDRLCKLMSHLGRSWSVKSKNVKEGGYIRQDHVGSIREAVRVLIERLRSLVQPSKALAGVLMRKTISIHHISEYSFTGLTLSCVVKTSP